MLREEGSSGKEYCKLITSYMNTSGVSHLPITPNPKNVFKLQFHPNRFKFHLLLLVAAIFCCWQMNSITDFLPDPKNSLYHLVLKRIQYIIHFGSYFNTVL